MKVTISRHGHALEHRYSVVTDQALADGRFTQDHHMTLIGNELVSVSEPGLIRIGGTLKFTLGPVSFEKVSALQPGDGVSF